MTRTLAALVAVLAAVNAALYAGIVRRETAVRPSATAAPPALCAPAAPPAAGSRRAPAAVDATAGLQPAGAGVPAAEPARRLPAAVDGRLVAAAFARAEKLDVPKRVRGVFVYAVEPGDWAEDISRRFGVPLEVILDVHGIGREDLLHPGDLLCLPIIEYTERVGLASWYGPGFDRRQGANGAVYHQDGVTVAALHYPFDLRLEIERLDNRKRVAVPVADRGPYFDGRIVDLSRGAARELEAVRAGVVEVVVRPVNAHLAAIDRYLAGRPGALARRA